MQIKFITLFVPSTETTINLMDKNHSVVLNAVFDFVICTLCSYWLYTDTVCQQKQAKNDHSVHLLTYKDNAKPKESTTLKKNPVKANTLAEMS